MNVEILPLPNDETAQAVYMTDANGNMRAAKLENARIEQPDFDLQKWLETEFEDNILDFIEAPAPAPAALQGMTTLRQFLEVVDSLGAAAAVLETEDREYLINYICRMYQ